MSVMANETFSAERKLVALNLVELVVVPMPGCHTGLRYMVIAAHCSPRMHWRGCEQVHFPGEVHCDTHNCHSGPR